MSEVQPSGYWPEDEIIVPEACTEKLSDTEASELSPETLEKVMDKVQDIEAPGIAFHYLNSGTAQIEIPDRSFNNIETFRDALRQGLLNINWFLKNEGHKIEWQDTEDSFGELQVPIVKPDEEGIATRRGRVNFNITGRMHDPLLFYGEDGDTEIMRTPHGGDETGERIAILFDLSSFRHIDEHNLEDLTSLPSRTYAELIKSEDDYYGFNEKGEPKLNPEEGLIAAHRIAPRFFRGVVIDKPVPAYTDEERDALLEKWVNEDIEYKQQKLSSAIERAKSGETGYYQKEIDYLQRSLAKPRNEITSTLLVERSTRLYRRAANMEETSAAIQPFIDLMLNEYGDKPELLVPVYDPHGNLYWPRQMSHEEVKSLTSERGLS